MMILDIFREMSADAFVTILLSLKLQFPIKVFFLILLKFSREMSFTLQKNSSAYSAETICYLAEFSVYIKERDMLNIFSERGI